MEIKTLPLDLDMEKQVLSACFVGNDDAFGLLHPGHFYSTLHATLFAAMESLHERGEPVDIPLVAGEIKRMGKVIEWSEAGKILDYPPSADPTTHARKLIGYYQLREAYKVCHAAQKRILAASPDDALSVSAYLKCELDRIDGNHASAWCSLSDVVAECLDSAEALRQQGGITGVTSGFRDLDWYMSGFQPSDLIILAARPSMGKTAFAINCMANAASHGIKSGFLSLEMSRRQVGNRFLSVRASVNALKFRSGRFIPEDWDKMSTAADVLSRWGVWIDDAPKANYQDIKSKARSLITQHGAHILWIDYLGFIDGDKDSNRVQEVQSITRSLKQTAKEYNIPIVLVAQLSRECEKRPNKRPILSDLRDSGAIEQDADVVLFLYRDDYYHHESKDAGTVELSISKQRNGPTGTIKLAWQEEFTRFRDMAKEAA